MNINRYNYEEFFLLYVDNELDSASRKAVELFIEENPDLKGELLMLQQSTLKADNSIKLDKSELFRKESIGLVNMSNYEEFFVLYVDQELSVEERRAVEEFTSLHLQFRKELELLMQTRTTADLAVSFPDKSLLFREERSEKPVVFLTFSRSVAIAAILLLAVGIFWMVNQSETSKRGQSFATKTEITPLQNSGKSESSKTESAQSSTTDPATGIAQIESSKDKADSKAVVPRHSTKDDNRFKSAEQVAQVKKHDEPIETVISHSPVTQSSRLIASNETTITTEAIDLTDRPSIQLKSDPVVTTASFNPDDSDKNEEVKVAGVDTKNKLRGFFRKVTRVVGKATHLPGTENKSLLIGNIEIALK